MCVCVCVCVRACVHVLACNAQVDILDVILRTFWHAVQNPVDLSRSLAEHRVNPSPTHCALPLRHFHRRATVVLPTVR